jgi:hypothetical protein
MSLTDPNIRRLLDLVKKMKLQHEHFALLKNPRYHPEATGWAGLAYTNLDQFEERCLIDLGVVPIWFDKYEDIPQILSSLSSTDIATI